MISAIHVGDHPYHDYNHTCETYLIDDWMRSIAYTLPTLLNEYKVLIYNGQLDIILAGLLSSLPPSSSPLLCVHII